MADFFEIDFLKVETKKSGDAIALRYELQGETFIMSWMAVTCH